VPAVPLTAAILVVAGLSLVPLQLSQPAMDALHLASPTTSPTVLTWLYLFLLGVVGTGISTAVFVWMILERGPLFAGMTTYVVPVLSLLWGQVDSERITPQQMAAIAGVLAMVALVQSGSRRVAVIAEPSAPPQPVTLPEAISEAIAPAALPGALADAVATLPALDDSLAPSPESQVA
jgi:hypothetical protein